MPRHTFVDFRAVKAAITMEQVLDHYDLTSQFKRSGDSLSGPCPIHQGENPTQFRVSLSKNIWNCFSQCKCGGNVLDFISRMENVSIHGAALNAIDWFHLDQAAMSADSDEKNGHEEPKSEKPAKSKPQAKKTSAKEEKKTPNVPLKFHLDKLDPTHPYLAERGLSEETIAEFGLGFCAKGIMADRIAIPIHNAEGKIVAYAGRFPGEPEEDTPKYKLPPGFRKGLEIFNLHRAIHEPAGTALVIVEGFFDCMRLHQLGYHNHRSRVRKYTKVHQSRLYYGRRGLPQDRTAPADRRGSKGGVGLTRSILRPIFHPRPIHCMAAGPRSDHSAPASFASNPFRTHFSRIQSPPQRGETYGRGETSKRGNCPQGDH